MRQPSFVNHNKNKFAALLDIGSTSVGGALVDISGQKDGMPPTIVWSQRKEIPFQNTIDLEYFLQGILNALKIVATAMSAEAKEHPAALFCTLSSPWYLAQTRIAKSSFAKPEIITQKIIDALVDAETAAFRRAYSPQAPSGAAALLEQKIIQVRLNGYATQKPYGKR
ncbi:MAG: hypothetical protein HZC03_00955, partial [Candidatus Lloydbacteria bacterium]|nr:hypothetical protein [Candidatus Lloydbacteria bacterium]